MVPASRSADVSRELIRQHGGLTADHSHQAHAQAILNELRPALGHAHSFEPRVRVLATSELAAFAITPRDVFVSEGLLETASDSEVRAAIAHELGHLVEAQAGVVSALVGQAGMACPEARADRFATDLLAKADRDPAAMAGLLKRLINQPCNHPALHAHLTERHGLMAH